MEQQQPLEFIKATEAARKAGITYQAVWRYATSGRWRSAWAGARLLVAVADLEAYLAERTRRRTNRRAAAS